MDTFLHTNRLHYLLAWTLLGLLLLLLVLEGWRYGVKPSEANNEQLIEQSLTEASNYFLSKQKTLLSNTEDLAATLQSPLLQERSSQYLHNTLTQFPQFWGIVLYQEKNPITWTGFALGDSRQPNPSTRKQEPTVSLKKHNNVIYWEFHVPFTVQDSSGMVNYDLLTSYRVEQRNPLPIGDRNEFTLFSSSEFTTPYPLNFTIFSSPPQEYEQLQQLTNLQGDSVGVVYATADKFQQTKQQWEQNTAFWRSVFALFCFLTLTCLLYWAADQLPLWRGLFLQLLFISIGWGIFFYTNMLSYWILTLGNLSPDVWSSTVDSISFTCTNALFALIAAITAARKINCYNKQINPDSYLVSIVLASGVGVLNSVGILSVFDLLYHASINSNVPLLDLRILPQWGTIVLYLALGMSVLALGIILISLNRLLFRATSEYIKLTASVLIISFGISLFVAQLFMPLELTFFRILYTSFLSFAVILGFAIAHFRDTSWITDMSPLRKIVIGSFVIAGLSIPVIYQASLEKVDNQLWTTAKEYAQEEDPLAEELTQRILTQLEKQLQHISKEDLQTRSATLQARFTETIQQFLSPEWNTYSFDLQLIDSSGTLIADYATDLNSPNWTQFFSIPRLEMVTDIEQITKSTIRPIVQLPQLINQQDYHTFYRGWIPIFGTSEDTPIAWVLCSIYKERPEFNKPIRAVMASLDYEDWNTAYQMQKYQDGQMIHSAQQGFTGYFSQKQTLSTNERQALQQDSLIYITQQNPEQDYRTLLWKSSEQTIIKVSTTLSDYRIILFTFFRFSFILLITGGLLLLLAQLISWKYISLLGKNKRFQDRILDSFLLATLVFLTFLIIASHYAIKQQNQDIVRQELFNTLESLSQAVQENQQANPSINLNRSFSLDTLTTPLNVDASFYNGRTVSETTTPQIYQQHLLPSVLPYEIYDQLFVQRQQDAFSTVNLAGQSLLIGYRSIRDDENKPAGTIAIPTFLESPKYDQQLLQTTSYLILMYLLVFGLFIIASTAISKKLTRPLEYIQQGLNKISAGNLDTKIPVKSDDEIGSLAEAYNNMVSRLKNLQKELAAAEREAAWKEMAQQVAHEIKNPLTPMKLNVQHLERQLKGDDQNPEKLKKQVQKITNNLIEQIQSLNNIASDFSKFSQPLEEEFTNVDLVDVLLSVTDLYEHDQNVTISLEAQKKTMHVSGIRDELKRVLINLVKNAYEAMPDGNGDIVLRLYQKQRHVFVEVEDNGKGIAEEDRENIFVPNFSTKSSGTGLGLAICKKIIEAHEGSISFASVEGEGTTFVIKLPKS